MSRIELVVQVVIAGCGHQHGVLHVLEAGVPQHLETLQGILVQRVRSSGEVDHVRVLVERLVELPDDRRLTDRPACLYLEAFVVDLRFRGATSHHARNEGAMAGVLGQVPGAQPLDVTAHVGAEPSARDRMPLRRPVPSGVHDGYGHTITGLHLVRATGVRFGRPRLRGLVRRAWAPRVISRNMQEVLGKHEPLAQVRVERLKGGLGIAPAEGPRLGELVQDESGMGVPRAAAATEVLRRLVTRPDRSTGYVLLRRGRGRGRTGPVRGSPRPLSGWPTESFRVDRQTALAPLPERHRSAVVSFASPFSENPVTAP